jgi:hypothetical protein
VHGFAAVLSPVAHGVLWKIVLVGSGLAGSLILTGTALATLGGSWRRAFFGIFLIATAVKMLLIKETTDPNSRWAVRLTRRLFPVTERFHGEPFLVRAGSSAAELQPVPPASRAGDPGRRRGPFLDSPEEIGPERGGAPRLRAARGRGRVRIRTAAAASPRSASTSASRCR